MSISRILHPCPAGGLMSISRILHPWSVPKPEVWSAYWGDEETHLDAAGKCFSSWVSSWETRDVRDVFDPKKHPLHGDRSLSQRDWGGPRRPDHRSRGGSCWNVHTAWRPSKPLYCHARVAKTFQQVCRTFEGAIQKTTTSLNQVWQKRWCAWRRQQGAASGCRRPQARLIRRPCCRCLNTSWFCFWVHGSTSWSETQASLSDCTSAWWFRLWIHCIHPTCTEGGSRVRWKGATLEPPDGGGAAGLNGHKIEDNPGPGSG